VTHLVDIYWIFPLIAIGQCFELVNHTRLFIGIFCFVYFILFYFFFFRLHFVVKMPKRRLRSGSNLPMNSSCFLCNIEIPGDSKDLFEHFRSIHFITTEPAKDSPIYIDEQPDDNENDHCPDLEELSFHDIAMECGEVPLDADVSKWTAEDVARKLRMEAFDQTVIDTFKGKILIFWIYYLAKG
jgi:hypothetical protein